MDVLHLPPDTSPHGILRQYTKPAIFQRGAQWWTPDNPFRRTLLNESFAGLDFSTPLSLDEICTNRSLIANRVLLSIYERDFVFLSRAPVAGVLDDMNTFYGRDLRVMGELLCEPLEQYLFRAVSDAVQTSGPWDEAHFCAYFESFCETLKAEKNAAVMDLIVNSSDPEGLARSYFVQLAGDFLVESSAMTRNVIGNYGKLQSELFKVVIDECGYGVHPTKHSKLFEDVLVAHNMDPVPHTYWALYTPGALFLNNYYNVICRDHSKIFRYMGGILQVETSFKLTCRQMKEMSQAVFGDSSEVRYFQEHIHIDAHHSRMVFEDIVRPAIRQHGREALVEIVRGFEESLIVSDVYAANLMLQLGWLDRIGRGESGGDAGDVRVELSLAAGQLYGTEIRDEDSIITIERGRAKVLAGYERLVPLEAGQRLAVPAGALFGIEADEDSLVRICEAATR